MSIAPVLSQAFRIATEFMGWTLEQSPHQKEIQAVKDSIALLDKRRAKLEAKLLRLVTRGPSAVVEELRRDALRPNEKLTRKNRTKFEVLGRIRYYLRSPDRRAGLSSAELHDLVQRDMPTLSFDTFRSYLSRFKADGRLLHNERHKLWKLAAVEADSGENN